MLFYLVIALIPILAIANFILIREYIKGIWSWLYHHIILLIPSLIVCILLFSDDADYGPVIGGVIVFFFILAYEILLFLQLVFSNNKRGKYYPSLGYILLIIAACILGFGIAWLILYNMSFKIGG
jgi:hypothetical protein